MDRRPDELSISRYYSLCTLSEFPLILMPTGILSKVLSLKPVQIGGYSHGHSGGLGCGWLSTPHVQVINDYIKPVINVT